MSSLALDAQVLISEKAFEGRVDVWRKSDLRILDAGGGTGDCTLTFAEQLQRFNAGARVVHLDLSAKSQEVARARAQHQGLLHLIQFVHGSLLDEELMASLGDFDFIQCTGVLHHLIRPADGLSKLQGVLRPGGAMGLMVYGALGRTGVYDVQDIMRGVSSPIDDEADEVKHVKALLKALPASSRVRKSGVWHAVEAVDQAGNDAEIYDLFLHSQDRPYTVDELYEWVERDVGMRIVGFNEARPC